MSKRKNKREFLMLAHKYDPAKYSIGGYFVSEKLDGQRAFWDGGLTRGMWKDEVYFANTAKDGRLVCRQKATGLWSRYGNVIHAPATWLDLLPAGVPLDGELYFGEGSKADRQQLRKIVSRLDGSIADWMGVSYLVFAMPKLATVLARGNISGTNFTKIIVPDDKLFIPDEAQPSFRNEIMPLSAYNSVVRWHEQEKLPMQTSLAEARINELLDEITDRGGEGLMLRNPDTSYECCRSHNLLKVKKLDDAEGTVIGYTTGRETDKGSKLLGLMGALILRLDNGARLELSGFTEAERLLNTAEGFESTPGTATKWAENNPGIELPSCYQASAFPRGTRVTFRYRGLTNDGIPSEARYWRKHDEC